MGSEGPIFLLYDNGNILHWKSGVYRLTHVDDKEQLISALNLRDTIFNKSRLINSTSSNPNDSIVCCDIPSFSFSTNFNSLTAITVIGSIKEKQNRKRWPSTLTNLYKDIVDFDDEKAIIWIPEKVEVSLSDYNNSPDSPIPWPKNWPGLNSPETRKNGDYVTSIFLEKKYFYQLTRLIKGRREKQDFEISGKKY